jgi:predicted nucleic acid-binding protein
MTERLRDAEKLYLDANLIIYFFERDDVLREKVGAIFDHAVLSETKIAISEIGVAECLFGAFRFQSLELERKYRELFYEMPLIELVPVDGERLFAAAKLGAAKGLKLVDAVHFLAAIESQCDMFITNDQRFKSSHGVTVQQLKDL